MKKAISDFIWYKVLYPVCNPIGLNRPLNLFRHWLGVYPRYSMGGRCQWCGGTTRCFSQKELQEQMKKNRENMEKDMRKLKAKI